MARWTQPVTVSLPPPLLTLARALARRRGVTLTGLVCDVLQREIDATKESRATKEGASAKESRGQARRGGAPSTARRSA